MDWLTQEIPLTDAALIIIVGQLWAIIVLLLMIGLKR